MQTIHCKVTNTDETIRRFLFVGGDINTLKETISKLFSLNHEFVLKYLDDESDYITIENENDLMTALEITPNLLRLKIATVDAPAIQWGGKKQCRRRKHGCGGSPVHPHHHGHGHFKHHWGGAAHHGWEGPAHHGWGGPAHHGWGGPSHHGHSAFGPEFKKFRAEKKLCFIRECLKELSSIEESKLSPHDLRRKQRLERKQKRLEACLNGQCPRKLLSPEEQQFNASIRMQMFEIRAEIHKVKSRQRELKFLLQANPGEKSAVDELAQLKEKKAQFKAQRRALCEKMHS